LRRAAQCAVLAILASCSSHHSSATSTGPAPTGTVVGTITSGLGGSLAGVHVVVTPSGGAPLTAVLTTSAGGFVATSVPVTTDNGTVTLSALPANCPIPSPTSYTGLTGGDTLTVDMTVVCSALVGTVRGTVTSSLGGGLAGVGVIVTPHTGGALGAALTGSDGTYTVSNVPADTTGTVTLTNLPGNCTAPSAVSYSGLAYGDTVTVGITVTCVPAAGAVTGTVASSLGGGLAGVQVMVTPSGGTALPAVTTTVAGVYTVTGVPVGTGAGAVTVSGVPGYCAAPSAASYTGLTAGVTVTTNLSVQCVVATGTVSGTVTSSQGGGLAGVQVVVTPIGGAALPAVTTTSGGAFTVSHVPAGSGSVALTSGLPLQCSAPSAVPYTGLAYNGTATTNVVAPCQPLGSLTVTVAPPNLGSATVTGPGGYTQTVRQTTTLTGLVPGAYTATATSYEVPGAVAGTVYDGTVTGSPAQVTGGTTSGLSVSYGVRGGTGELWIGSEDGSTFDWAAYTNAQLLAGGTPTPVASGSVFAEFGAAVDRNGTIWLTGLSLLAGFTPTALASGGLSAPHISINIPYGYFSPTFDAAGNLWTQGDGAIGELTAAQLAAGGSQNFAKGIATNYDERGGMAFGPDGTLWVANSYAATGSDCYLWGFTPAQQASGGGPAITVTLTNARSIQAIAFDANWNLWVSLGPNQINMYTQSQLAAGGAPSAADSIFTTPTVYPQTIAFDASDNLWVGSTNDSTLSAYTPLQLTTSGTPTPALTVKLRIPPLWLVFDPQAPTLLLNGSRVAPTKAGGRSRLP
jgi:hypothetical protein